MGRTEKIMAASGTLVALGGGAVTSLALSVFPAYATVIFWGGIALIAIGLALLIWALLRKEDGQSPSVTQQHFGSGHNISADVVNID